MSNEDDDEPAGELDPADLETRLDDAGDALEAAETEADLDDVESTLDSIESDLEAADLPEPEDDDEEDPTEAIESRLSDLRDDLESQRGPYAEDVSDIVDEAAATLRDTRWTEDGEPDAIDAAEAFGEAASDILDRGISVETNDEHGAADSLEAAAETIANAGLDADEDAETIAELLEAAEQLEANLDAAEEWDDLTVREQLDAQGFYDVLNPKNRKDYPAEWNAVKVYEQMRDVQPILKALDRFESDFMEENILDALEHIAPEEAFDAVHQRAQRRAVQPIRILGRIGDDRACETLHDFLGGGDVKLEKTSLRALGAIGSEESTQHVANRLVADDPEIRSVAARSLGLIGDTRAIEPLEQVLETDDADEVRASAAWALNQIGTERALDAAAQYADDRSYIVQVEAEKAAGV
ncbi:MULTISPECIES: HEAT repeat domain-containing protein [Salinibaculum]|uniref:HEAT repeat domain-containing protein n=1 Tax=Salinibaculum TaxID=2732368 RepID=UPI0030D4D196